MQYKLTHNTTFNWFANILKSFGIWPPDDLKGWKKYLYYLYSSLLHFILLGVFIISEAVFLYEVKGNLELMTGVSLIFFTNVVHVIKILTVMRKRRTIQRIINELDELAINASSPNKEKIVKIYAVWSVKFYLLYLIWTFLVIQFWIFGAVVSNIKNGTRIFPMPGWFPYDETASPYFYITLGQQFFAFCIGPQLNVTKDCLITGLINQVSCQLVLLKDSLVSITDEQENIKSDGNTVKHNNEEIIHSKLKLCIKHHQRILEIARDIESCFKYIVLIQFSVSLLIICVTAFQLAMQIGSNLINLFGLATYLLNMICQVLVYCWHGNEVIIHSEEILNASYVCNWYKQPQKFQHLLKTLMIRSVIPVKFSTGGFATLSINTFMAIMKVSYSFFTVLQQVNNDASVQ